MVTKITNSNCDKGQTQIFSTQITAKLKKNQIVTKLKNSNCYKTNSNCDKTQKLKW